MNFRLIWTGRAVAELTAIYLTLLKHGGDADAVTQASARVDQSLARDPANLGESRAGHERVTFEPPLTVYFEVHEDERVVAVTSVRYTAHR